MFTQIRFGAGCGQKRFDSASSPEPPGKSIKPVEASDSHGVKARSRAMGMLEATLGCARAARDNYRRDLVLLLSNVVFAKVRRDALALQTRVGQRSPLGLWAG